MADATDTPRARPLSEPPVRPFVLWLLTLLFMSGASFALPLHADTAWEITLARRCVQEGVCDVGVPASLPGTTHGAFILRIIELVLLLKLPFATLRFVTTGLISAAVVVAVHQVRYVFRWRLSWLAYALITLLASVRFSSSVVWNVSPHPLFCALFTLGLLKCISTGRLRDAVLCTASLGMAIDSELAAVIVLPVTCALLFASAERPLPTLLAGVGAFVAGPLLFSGQVWAHNVEALFTRHPHLLIAGGVAIAGALLAGFLLRQRWQALSLSQRLIVAMALLTLIVQGFAAIATDLGVIGGSQSWYLGASWTSEVCLVLAVWNTVGASIRRGLSLLGNVAAAVILVSVFVENGVREYAMWRPWASGAVPAWSVDDVERLAGFLGPRGVSQHSASRHLWTSGTDDVVKHLLNFLPEKDDAPYAGPDYLVVKTTGSLRPEGLPKGWSLLPLGWGQQALVHSFYSQLDAAPVHISLRREGKEPQLIETTKLDWQARGERGRVGISGANLGARDRLDFVFDRLPPRPARLFLTVHPPDQLPLALAIGDTRVPCHMASDRERTVAVETQAVVFPDLIEIEPGDRAFLARALPTLDWTGCPAEH